MSANYLMDDIEELKTIVASVTSERLQKDLRHLLATKEAALVQAQQTQPRPVAAPKPAVVTPAASAPVSNDNIVYTEISTFAWDDEGYGKPKVTVYITSGIDGVGSLPSDHITCDFTTRSFDLKIKDLNGKNYRLVRYNLDKDIVPNKSKFVAKKNRVTITLVKADDKNTWMNLTAKSAAPTAKPNSADPSAGIMDMMKNMYDEGDDEMKRTIAKAWSESRNKNPGGADVGGLGGL
ncbi:hypothetical protein H257_05294 [Aphanomyces astaci]|uniref:Calcyclin-binding protein n=1 Tax=Aphanomyces astaci TaxID=112090 RepID=W4GQS0_APHAT|nr:hypothetical protein H257_05294 [Aphanomyces astaci]ETV81681.1 hypothetical protein H257_05294 [Aphanomyces astaci]RQM27468.1 hypothetical protein B5M09_007482 [Aphanomyces astaci]|eukprot:XP_009828418.1 hypothetical protein H257_05294 [Aphanomyces astaci]